MMHTHTHAVVAVLCVWAVRGARVCVGGREGRAAGTAGSAGFHTRGVRAPLAARPPGLARHCASSLGPTRGQRLVLAMHDGACVSAGCTAAHLRATRHSGAQPPLPLTPKQGIAAAPAGSALGAWRSLALPCNGGDRRVRRVHGEGARYTAWCSLVVIAAAETQGVPARILGVRASPRTGAGAQASSQACGGGVLGRKNTSAPASTPCTTPHTAAARPQQARRGVATIGGGRAQGRPRRAPHLVTGRNKPLLARRGPKRGPRNGPPKQVGSSTVQDKMKAALSSAARYACVCACV